MTKKNDRKAEAAIDGVILEVVDHCLATSDPPEVGIHYARLQKEGFPSESAKRLIGAVLITYLYEANNEIDQVDFVGLRFELAQLPMVDLIGDGSFRHVDDIFENEAPDSPLGGHEGFAGNDWGLFDPFDHGTHDR